MKQVAILSASLLAAVLMAACGGGGKSNGYGAVASSAKASKVAISSEQLTQSLANDAARDACDEKDCQVILQFKECGGAAQGYSPAGVLLIAAGKGDTEVAAQTAANEACKAQGAPSCGQIPNVEAVCN